MAYLSIYLSIYLGRERETLYDLTYMWNTKALNSETQERIVVAGAEEG